MNNVQVLILAGGAGKRMWPLKTNKNLLPFFGKPLLAHQIEAFQKVGFDDLIVIVNPQIKKQVEAMHLGVKLAVQEKPLGQGDAILAAEKYLDGRPLLVANADDFFRIELLEKIKKVKPGQSMAFLVGQKVRQYFHGGYLVMKGGRVVGVMEKPGKGNEPSDLVKLVLDLFFQPRELLTAIKKVGRVNVSYETALDNLMKAGVKFGLIEYCGPWATIKYPWDILSMVDFFLQEKKQKQVLSEKSVKILKGAIVKNSYLGENVIIGNNALVRDSIIEEGSVIGYSAETARSYIGPDCWLHSNYVGDSVLEKNINFGSGARTANLRLDEKEITTGKIKLGAIVGAGSRVGINASLMPGAMIGSNSFIGAGLVFKGELKDNQFCYLKQEIVKKKNLTQ